VVLDLEEAGGHEPIEVKGGERPADARPGSRSVAVDGTRLRRDELVQGTADRLGKSGNSIEGFAGHRATLSHIVAS
jgi:hypothetical protein